MSLKQLDINDKLKQVPCESVQTFWINEDDGNDEEDGLSPETAWRTWPKIFKAIGRDCP